MIKRSIFVLVTSYSFRKLGKRDGDSVENGVVAS
jgi:hypothetical protein